MESFVQDYLNYTFDEELNEGLLERRLSPYATLRPGDLAALLRLQPLLLVSRFNCNHGNETVDGKNRLSDVDVIFEGKECGPSEDESEDEKTEGQRCLEIICRGADTNNSPAEYTVKGLHQHEMPVIGICVDSQICPGFRYYVRRAGSDRFLFNNQSKTLLSIGMGYGKRLTFSSDNLNNNDCFFWSDSEPNGYAFSLHAVDVGQRFSILDSDNVIAGEAVIEDVDAAQKEISTVISEDKTIIKHVKVIVTCSIKYYQRHNHGLVEMMAQENLETFAGEAVLTKTRGKKTAALVCIQQVFLQRYGLCKLEPEV